MEVVVDFAAAPYLFDRRSAGTVDVGVASVGEQFRSRRRRVPGELTGHSVYRLAHPKPVAVVGVAGADIAVEKLGSQVWLCLRRTGAYDCPVDGRLFRLCR